MLTNWDLNKMNAIFEDDFFKYFLLIQHYSILIEIQLALLVGFNWHVNVGWDNGFWSNGKI